MTTVYLCYQSLLDPLTFSQVVAYLEGLAKTGYRPILVTFEPRRLNAEECARWERRLLDLGIGWRQLRYHKRPTVPSTMLDIACGVVLGLWLIARYRVGLVHARSHVPAVMAATLGFLTGVPFLFDIRGLLAEEYVDAQIWPADGLLFRTTKRVERLLVARAAGIIVLTRKAAALLREWYPVELDTKPLEVIPCCVDLRLASGRVPVDWDSTSGSSSSPSLVYVGKLGGRYASQAMVELFAAARRIIPDLRWTVLTQCDPSEIRAHAVRHGVESSVTIGRVGRDEVLAELSKASAGLALYRGGRSAAACSPTKIPEYLAAGLPVVASSGLGDIPSLLGREDDATGWPCGDQPVGVIVDEANPQDLERAALELTRLVADTDVRARCRAFAERHFDLEAVGWSRYRRLYRSVVGQTCLERGWPGVGSCSQERFHQIEAVITVAGHSTPK